LYQALSVTESETKREKERDTLDYCRASIQSCLWNLENPKIEQCDKDWFVKDLGVKINILLSII